MEPEYRAAIKPLGALAKQYGCSAPAIVKHAAKNKWSRDLAARIRAKAQAKVNEQAVNTKVNAQRGVNEKVVVEANATLQASIQLTHRADLLTSKQTIMGLIRDLGALSNTELQEALELVLDEKTASASDTYKAALTKAFHSALALASRSMAGKNLVMSLGILIDKERVAFGIAEEARDYAPVNVHMNYAGRA